MWIHPLGAMSVWRFSSGSTKVVEQQLVGWFEDTCELSFCEHSQKYEAVEFGHLHPLLRCGVVSTFCWVKMLPITSHTRPQMYLHTFEPFWTFPCRSLSLSDTASNWARANNDLHKSTSHCCTSLVTTNTFSADYPGATITGTKCGFIRSWIWTCTKRLVIVSNEL